MTHHSMRMTVFATAMTSGLLLALAVHMLSGRFGIALPVPRLDVLASNAGAVRAAFGWWAIAGAGLIGSFFASLLMRDALTEPTRYHGMRRLIVALFVIGLAGVPHFAAAGHAADLHEATIINLTAFALGAVTSFCGSWFALPR
jgi:hypothetical protein